MKKIISAFACTASIILFSSISIYAASPTIDTSNLSKGYVTVKGSENMVVQISKADKKYNYTLVDSNPTNFPLQLGNGSYKILVLKKVSGNQYSASATETVSLDTTDTNVYLNSIQLVDFDESMVSVDELSDLIDDKTTDYDKALILYDYFLDNMTYDYNKASKLANASNYLPVIDDTYVSEQGICYDMSSLFASILRYNNIPTKLVMGYTPNVSTYHAWNEIYYDNEWHVLDVTYDIGVVKAKKTPTMLKNTADYSVTKSY